MFVVPFQRMDFYGEKKKNSLISGNQSDEIFLLTTHSHKANLYENIYFLL